MTLEKQKVLYEYLSKIQTTTLCNQLISHVRFYALNSDLKKPTLKILQHILADAKF